MSERSEIVPAQDPALERKPKFQLKRLSPKHKQMAALLAQGVGRETIAVACKCTPQYVTMLSQQPLFRDYMDEMMEFADSRLSALFGKSVDVIADTLQAGSEKGRLAAARLQMEAVGKVKRGPALTVNNQSLIAILSGMPSGGAQTRTVPNWNTTDEAD